MIRGPEVVEKGRAASCVVILCVSSQRDQKLFPMTSSSRLDPYKLHIDNGMQILLTRNARYTRAIRARE